MKKLFKSKNKNKNQRRSQESLGSGRSMSTNKYYRPKNTKPVVQPRVSQVSSSHNVTPARLINVGIGVMVLVVMFFASTLSTVPSIKIQNSAPTYRERTAYTDFASSYIKRSPIHQSKLLFRSVDFEQAMTQEFPEIDQISAVIPLGGRKLDVNISLSVPLAVVMNGSQVGAVDSSGALVTNDIDALLLNSPDQLLPKLRFSAPQDNFSAGVTLLTSTEVELLQLITSELQSSKIFLNGASEPLQVSEFLFNVADGQLEVRFNSQPFFVKYSIYGDVQLQVGTMLQSLQQLNREGQLPVSYMDVRVPGKVYIN